MSVRYELAPGVIVAVTGDGADARHLRREYGAPIDLGVHTHAGPRSEPPRPVLELVVGPASRTVDGVGGAGGHRAARWRTRLDLAGRRLGLHSRGPLGPLLAQSFVVEPVLSLLVAAADRVLLPGALLLDAAGPTLVLGGSGAGKSTLALRALAAGVSVAADDQVLLGAAGAAGLPRRLRVYPDLATVAPAAHAALPAPVRRRLRIAQAVATATGGRVCPPTAVGIDTVRPGAGRSGRDVIVRRALVLGPGARPTRGELGELARGLLAAQRSSARVSGATATTAQLHREGELIDSALADVEIERVDVRAEDALRSLIG